MADMLSRDSRSGYGPALLPSAATFEAGIMCEKCNNRLVELKRQVLRLILPEIQGVLQNRRKLSVSAGSLSSRLIGQIRLSDVQLKSWRDGQCEVCATNLDQLKGEAVAMVHNLEEAQFLAYYNIPGYVVGPSAEQLIRQADKYRHQGNAAAEPMDRGLARPEEVSSGSFLSRAAQKLSLTTKKKHKKEKGRKQEGVIPQPMQAPVVEAPLRRHAPPEVKPYPFPTNFKEILRKSSSPVPPSLLKMNKRTDGKVKVMLRVCPSFPGETGSFMKLDLKRKQVTLYDPNTVGHVSQTHRKMGVAAPKMFAFDSIFEADTTQTQICSGSIVDVLQTVVSGSDGCVFSYGHAGLGKTYSMIGRDENEKTMGIIPTALYWLFRLIKDQRIKNGTRFSVRISAVEIVGRSENLRDLLLEQAAGSENGTANTPSPSVFLRDDKSGAQHATELRVSSADKAAYLLDAALNARTRPQNDKDRGDSTDWEETMNSHMFFTVHVYQYREDSQKTGEVHGGRSRLHLIDLASCEGYTGSKTSSGASSMSLSGLGNVVIALINGSKHVTHRTSKITKMLQESIGNASCRTTMIAHVSPSLPFYSETLFTAHLASRLHRLRKRKGKKGSGTSSSGGDSSCDEARIRRPRMRTAEPRVRTSALSDRLREDCSLGEPGSSDYNSSTGEESCDTVIYMGPDGALSDRELTDNEGPPASVPIRKTSSTRSLVRKLESIDQDLEANEEELTGEEEDKVCSEHDRREDTEMEATARCEHDGKAIVDSQSNIDNSSVALADKTEDKLSETCNSAAEPSTALSPSQSVLSTSAAADKVEKGGKTTLTQGGEFSIKTAGTICGITSPETSSESSDADSIVMAEKPSFSFVTCAAVHEMTVEEEMTMEDLFHHPRSYVAELIEQCEPASPASPASSVASEPLCSAVKDGEAKELYIDDLLYDDTELEWRKSDDSDTIFDCDFDDCLEIYEEQENELFFPGKEEDTESMRNGQEVLLIDPNEEACCPTNQGLDDDTDTPNSSAMATPMKTYYRLVPTSSHSSSTEEELEEDQMTSHDVTGKCLSPIPECPSVDENVDDRAYNAEQEKCAYNVVNVDDSRSSSPEVSSPRGSSKGDLRSLLQIFVAEQLRECEGGEFTPRFSNVTCRPEPRRPRQHRVQPLTDPADTAGEDVLLPPLIPQARTASDTAKVVPSRKLRSSAEWEAGSDTASCGRCTREGDDGTLSAETEPYTVPRRAAFRHAHHVTADRTISSVGVNKAVSANVTFLGCIDENNNYVENQNTDTNKTSSYNDEVKTKEKGSSPVRSVVADSATKRESRVSRTSMSSFVKLTYCGSELSDTEFDKRDESPCEEQPNMRPRVSAIFQKPKIERICIAPCTPYAPQEEYKKRYNERDLPARIVYRFSGEFTATVPPPPHTDAKNKRESYRVSGEYVATITTCAPPMQSSHSLTMTSSCTMDSGKPESVGSTEVVWIVNDALASKGHRVKERATSAPITSTPFVSRDGTTANKLKFSRDRESVSSGHASDSSVADSPRFRGGPGRSLWRSKSASRCDATSSSGYESMRNDTSQASSDSCSERGFGRSEKRGFRKRTRSSSPGRRQLSPRRWFSRKSLDTVKIKVYEVDDITLVQEAVNGNCQAQNSEQRHRNVVELRKKQGQLKNELTEAKSRLGEEEKRWSFGLRADQLLPRDDPRFVGALERENQILQQRIQACKSSVMMVTSFDVLVTQV